MVVVKIWQIMIVKRRWIEPEKKKILQIDQTIKILLFKLSTSKMNDLQEYLKEFHVH